MDSSFNIEYRKLKSSMIILEMMMEARELCLRFFIQALVSDLCNLENDA